MHGIPYLQNYFDNGASPKRNDFRDYIMTAVGGQHTLLQLGVPQSMKQRNVSPQIHVDYHIQLRTTSISELYHRLLTLR